MTPVRLENPKRRSGDFLNSKGFQLEVLKLDSGAVEYRVRRHSNGIGKGREGGLGVAIAFLAQCVWGGFNDDWSWTTVRWTIVIISLLFLYLRFTEVQHESVLAFPSIGIQLETHRGLSIFGRSVLSTGISRYFLPLHAISDIIINEGLCGWNVRRYLAILSTGESRLEIVFQTLDPPFPILKEVYHGLREALFDEWDESDRQEGTHLAYDNQG
ncbi:hypothetical protein B0J17DRAFT_657331 [Rhizoctonia solani]|nr:hypothetical protein B0J17DRAFT_657331 [Rhizoctonia solani]